MGKKHTVILPHGGVAQPKPGVGRPESISGGTAGIAPCSSILVDERQDDVKDFLQLCIMSLADKTKALQARKDALTKRVAAL